MEPNDRNMPETNEEEDFAELLKQSFVETNRLEPGQKVRAKIIKITPEWVFLDLGRKSEGYLSTRELLDEEGAVTVQEGETLQAFFLGIENNEHLFTTRIGGGEAKAAHLEEAWRSGIPVEGIVEKEIKGGFEVKIAGSIRAFCPYSQMGLQRAENPAVYVGERLSFKVTEFGERGRNIILSNRAVLEEKRQEQREALKETLEEGMTLRGAITSIRDFGAFVNVGAIEGLIPISEIAWGRVEDIRELLTVGQEVDVVAVRLDWEKNRYSFSMKEALPNPWDTVEERFPQGSFHVGKVARLTNFGAFVTVGDGVDGLIHISRLAPGKRINHPREVVTEGQVLDVKVESLDKQNKRLSLALAGVETEQQEQQDREDYERVLGEKPTSMGTLGDILKSRLSQEGKSKVRKR